MNIGTGTPSDIGTGFKKKPEQSGKHSRGSGSGIISAAQQIQRITDSISY
jgi:hypothetical protein